MIRDPYKQAKLAEHARRWQKQALCSHAVKIRVTIHCLSCGMIDTVQCSRNELSNKLDGLFCLHCGQK